MANKINKIQCCGQTLSSRNKITSNSSTQRDLSVAPSQTTVMRTDTLYLHHYQQFTSDASKDEGQTAVFDGHSIMLASYWLMYLELEKKARKFLGMKYF
jgi:hypothetical protein